jgi:hypothetical protein
MKWMRFRRAGNEGFGRVDREEVVVYDGELFGANRPTGERVALADVEWLVPCQPGKIVGLWNNFYALAAKNGWGRPAEPLYFLKAPGSALPHHGVIPSAPSELGRVFYEGELAIVIGRTARAVGVDAAREYIFWLCLRQRCDRRRSDRSRRVVRPVGAGQGARDAAEFDHRTDQRLEFERAAVLDVLQHRGLVRAHGLGAGDALVERDLEAHAQRLGDRLRLGIMPRPARVSAGKRQMSSSVAWVSAEIGLKLRLPHSLTQISLADVRPPAP